MTPSICLNMIVKNESHVIKETLVNLCSYFNFSYWVICDTGSTDGTQQIIRDFFGEKGISGELLEHEWRDFGYNRSLALYAAYDKTDYLLVFDADDRIVGDFKLPSEMTTDSYYLRIGTDFSYKRTLIVNNRKKWCFKGVLHEFITCLEDASQSVDITGNYYMESRRSGSRNNDPLKYSKDAAILEKAYVDEIDEGLRNRYVFYCAQSYKDAGNIPKAIEWYKKVLNLKTWDQEKYISYLRLGECFKHIGDEINMMYYWTKGYSFMPSRAETLYQLINYYRHKGEYRLCELYYNISKNIPNPGTSALFSSTDVYDYKLDEEYTIFSFYTGNKNIDSQMTRMIKDGRANMGLLMSNSNFYCENKLKIIKDANGQYKLTDNVFCFPSKTERNIHSSSKNILFFTGYSDRNWNYTYAKTHSLGGSEKAVAYLTQCFPKDYTIYVAGSVESEAIDNVIYVNDAKLAELLETTQFHTIICSRYVGFLEKYVDVLKFYQFYLWAHDTCLIHTDTNLTVNQVLEKWDKHIDGCVCLTDWHAEQFKHLYPTLTNKIHIINNGIVPELFAVAGEKITNRFIYSSRSERGLERLLELWTIILQQIPDATLVIFSYNQFPSSTLDKKIETEMLKYKDSISHLGQLNSSQMYEQMRLAEYWLYPTNWHETSCITALEMLASEVVCFYYPLAGLVDTMSTFGIQVSRGNEVDTIIRLTEEQKEEMRKKGREYALGCSWDNRAETWSELLQINRNVTITTTNYPIKIINLERRQDRKESVLYGFEKQGIKLGEEHFFIAVDGRKLKLTEELYKLFKGNNFNYRRSVIGCALSHYTIINQLNDSPDLSHFIVFEDDITLTNEIKYAIEMAQQAILSNHNTDIVFLGYSDEKYKKICSNSEELKIIKFENNINCQNAINYDGGLFGYLITKTGASKIINSVKTNGMQMVFDYFVIYTPNLNIYTFNQHVITTNIHRPFTNSIVDTDIQSDFETIVLDEDFINDNFVFIPRTDQEGYDLYNNAYNNNLNRMLLKAIDDNTVVAVNSYGWFKSTIVNLTISDCYKDKSQGIYIKKQAYLDYCGRQHVDNKDIELVSSQCNVSREKAQETLAKNNGDVVNSIIELMNDA